MASGQICIELIAIALWKVSPAKGNSSTGAVQQLDTAVLDSDCVARLCLCDHFPRRVYPYDMRRDGG